MNRKMIPVLVAATALLLVATPAFAEGDMEMHKGYIGVGAGIAMGFAVLGGGIGQGLASKGALEGIARNPGAQITVLIPMVLGLAFIESIVLFAFLIAYNLLGKV